ncbi:hypothetical protein ASPCAL05793 [Aspergillus calidoustus]|uniref:Uncharacterized protein n=1 Tax=Aspergillus calidoustus TaxID=454130 RepID=A0A0U5C7M0_ASPCI|nr:hypothetical protein ASPCAL05793 [Aspergillus calidoustus]
MAIMNRLVQVLCFSMIASSAVAAPAPERPKVDQDTISRIEYREVIQNIDKDSIQNFVDKIRVARASVLEDQKVALPSRPLFAKRQDSGSNSPAPTGTVTDTPTSTDSDTSDPPTSTSDTEPEPEPTTTTTTSSETTTTDPEPTTTTTTSTTSQPEPEPTPTSDTTQPPSSTTTTTSDPPTSTDSEPTSSSPEPTSSTTRATSTSSTSTSEETTTEESTTDSSTTTEFTSTFLSTSTRPDGVLVTVTATAVVHPTQSSDGEATTTGPAPGLQTHDNGASSNMASGLLAMMGGAAIAVAII